MSFGGGGGYVQQSDGERVNVDIAQEQWDYYKNDIAPLDDQMISRAQDRDRGRALGVNMATGAAGKAHSGAERVVTGRLMRRGINPNSGKFMTALTDTISERGRGVGMAGGNAEMAADKRYAGDMFNVIAHLRGQKGIALAGIRDTARMESDRAIFDARMEADENAAMMRGFGSLASIAGDVAYKKWVT